MAPIAANAQSVAAGWTLSDVGESTIPGYATFANDAYTVSGAGRIGSSADQFTFVYRKLTGDGTLIARVNRIQNSNPGARAGVMIRQSLDAGSMSAFAGVSATGALAFERRYGDNGDAVVTNARATAPLWLKLQRRASIVTASWSSDGARWTPLGSDVVEMNGVVYAGIAVASETEVAAATAAFSAVRLTPLAESGSRLPTRWRTADIGAPATRGAAGHDAGTFGVMGSGDLAETSDQFRFVYTTADGDLDFIARVPVVGDTDPWARAGVMVRESLDANAAHASMLLSHSGGTMFQRRAFGGAASTSTLGSDSPAAIWVKLSVRSGSVSAYESSDGVAWELVGTEAVTLPSPYYVGLAVTSHDAANAVTANIDSVRIQTTQLDSPQSSRTADSRVASGDAGADGAQLAAPPSSLAAGDGPIVAAAVPSEWTSVDIGSPSRAGSSDYNAGAFTVIGGGLDIWSTSDQFHYVYQQVTGDIDIVARLATLTEVDGWSKAGLMLRGALTANAAHASLFGSGSNGLAFQRRRNAGVMTDHTAAGGNQEPVWLKVTRRGSTISVFTSTTGTTWTAAGSDTITLPATFYVGLAVTAHSGSATATATFDNVSIVAGGNQVPTVALTAPAAGATFTAPASVTVSATASDTDGTIARVDFYQGSTQIGSDTSSPYSVTWSNVPAGTYSLTAVAVDNAGATATSAARSITVTTPANQAPTVALTAPANGASYTAPATITVSANASDADGTIARVDFYQGSTQIGSDTSSPYSVTWSNVAAGSYSLTAIAVDNAGAPTTSAAVSVTVTASTPPGSLPAGWTASDVGTPARAGATTHSGGTYTVTGGGLDIWGNADQFHYVYQQVSGDVDIVARLATFTEVDGWSKAGLMLRGALTANAVHASLFGSGSNGLAFQRRRSAGGGTDHTAAGSNQEPVWLKVTRRGTTISVFTSTTGTTWTAAGTDTITLPATFYVGLAVTAHSGSASATATFDNVSIVTGGNQLPTVALTAPAAGATFTAPASVTVSATASDTDGSIQRVDFYQGSTLIGSDTSSPYSVTWSNVAAGTYSLTAVAVDNTGATATSAARSITVNPSGGGGQRNAVFTASPDHNTLVSGYVFEVFANGANPSTATPLATQSLGKPAVVNGEITADVTTTINALAPGTYQATVSAIGSGGGSRSAPVTVTR
jgi:regulation of enolase protein 1 (concanavalin A-like superfamily)